jgi:hypothetical protein
VKLPRRRFWIPLAIAGLALGCVRVGLHYHAIGLLRGDAYYRWMPTSYWRDVATHQIRKEEPPRWLGHVERFIGWRPPPQGPDTPLFKRDPAAQAVLLQLALDPDTDHYVRVRAFETCAGPPLEAYDRVAVERCLVDPDDKLRRGAAGLLVRLNRSESALELIVADWKADLRASSALRRYRASYLLWELASESPSLDIDDLVRRIRPMLQDEDPDIRGCVEEVLERLEVVRAQRK